MADGGPVVARYVVLVAQDGGNRLVDHFLVGEEHRLALGAFRALAAVHQIDRAAQHLAGSVGQNAVGIEVAGGLLAAMAHDVVEVAALIAVPQVARADGGVCTVSAQVARKAGVGLSSAEHAVVDLDARILAGDVSFAVEGEPTLPERVDGRHVHPCVLAGEHAGVQTDDARTGVGGVKRDVERDGGVLRCHDIDAGHVRLAVDAVDADGGVFRGARFGGEHGATLASPADLFQIGCGFIA